MPLEGHAAEVEVDTPVIKVTHKGDLKVTTEWLKKMERREYIQNLEKFGEEGVLALSSATPVDSGETAHSWKYDIVHTKTSVTIFWFNTHVVDGANIAVILQYGHGTRNGGYVKGVDYINPAIQPVFENILNELRREVRD